MPQLRMLYLNFRKIPHCTVAHIAAVILFTVRCESAGMVLSVKGEKEVIPVIPPKSSSQPDGWHRKD
ncbi:hypothetical protein Trydic_g5562 [Trypoxylus dichotomus]